MQNNTFSTLFVGQNFITLKEVDSTNNYLKTLMSKSEPLAEGTVIMADNQFAGRGQQDSIWHTEAGKNISASLLLKPSFLPLNKQFYLNMAISLAINDALAYFIPEDMKIKWPNDIYHSSKKLGGILIENTLTGSVIKSSVVGVGLNVNQKIFTDSIHQKATSMTQILHKEIDLQDVMAKICVYVEKYYLVLRSGKYTSLQIQYLERLYKFNIEAFYKFNGEVFEGIIKGVEDSGQLIVETNQGKKSFNFKEIEFTHTN